MIPGGQVLAHAAAAAAAAACYSFFLPLLLDLRSQMIQSYLSICCLLLFNIETISKYRLNLFGEKKIHASHETSSF